MKLILFNSEYYLLSNDSIKVGEGDEGNTIIWILTPDGLKRLACVVESRVYCLEDMGMNWTYDKWYEDGIKNCHKALASTKGIEGLAKLDRTQIEARLLYNKINDIEKLAEEGYPTDESRSPSRIEKNKIAKGIWYNGYMKCLEVNADKKYTLNDLIQFACDVYNKNYKTDMSFKKRAETMAKELTSQHSEQTEWEVEADYRVMSGNITEHARGLAGYEYYEITKIKN